MEIEGEEDSRSHAYQYSAVFQEILPVKIQENRLLDDHPWRLWFWSRPNFEKHIYNETNTQFHDKPLTKVINNLTMSNEQLNALSH